MGLYSYIFLVTSNQTAEKRLCRDPGRSVDTSLYGFNSYFSLNEGRLLRNLVLT